MADINRRKFLKAGAAAAVAASATIAYRSQKQPLPPPDDGWNAGDIVHILPTANHRRFLIKVSFAQQPAEKPILKVNDFFIEGHQTDSRGLFYRFDVRNLRPDTQYTLQLVEVSSERVLCDPWPLKTFPAPHAEPDSFRLLAYTCAGGPDHLYNFGFFNAYLPTPLRQRLFARALSFAPDAVVANGDHVYWDLKSSAFMGNSVRARWVAGQFDDTQPVLGTKNEEVLKRAFGPQLADLYSVRFRSTPMFFLQDDHDYGENDEADDDLRTFPADDFMLDLARTTQSMYYPELIPEENFPKAYINDDGVAESFSALRYGKVFEGLLYDCRRYMTNELDPDRDDKDSLFVPAEIERWLLDRTAQSDTWHLAHMPSTPVLWTAGKWAEWYPDYMGDQGLLGIDVAKPYWPNGWLKQHDRLLDAVVANTQRTAMFISGDLHATGTGRIVANQSRSYAQNPVMSVLTGAIGTGALGWPSKFRGTAAAPSVMLEAEEWQKPVEANGFTLFDFNRDHVKISHFKWLPEDGDDAIDSLEPFSVITVPRPASVRT